MWWSVEKPVWIPERKIYRTHPILEMQRIRDCRTKWAAVVALDSKNAFNSASWSDIMAEIRRRNIPLYLINVIEGYFSQRKIRLNRTWTMGVAVP